MLKLYKADSDGALTHYWEHWETTPGTHTVHWGAIGTKGATKESHAQDAIAEAARMTAAGYAPVPQESLTFVVIEYPTRHTWPSEDELDKRYAVEDLMNGVLGWRGLGYCDGGSAGSGSMEVALCVVDVAKTEAAVREVLAGTPYADFSRIYSEG